jgi:hypothetical protein
MGSKCCRSAGPGRDRARRKKLIDALRWHHRWGGQTKHWQFMLDQGRNAPDGFYDCPEIEPHLAWLWDAFLELGSERQIGMAIGPIPGSKIGEYLRDEMELTGPEYDRARAIIRNAEFPQGR